MKIKIYTIFDAKAQFYNKPFYMHNDSVAKRALSDLRNDPNTDICKHPEDFILFSIGEYNDETAEITPTQPLVICRAHEIPKAEDLGEITKTEEEE